MENNAFSLTPYSQKLRREMTKEEKHLWYDFLKNLPCTVNRQHIIGDYIVDFYCDTARLVIELDGSQHYSEEGEAKDTVRDRFLEENGITVLRYSNLMIQTHFNDVCEDILNHIEKRMW